MSHCSRSCRIAAAELALLAQKDIDEQWHLYEQMAGMERDSGAKEVSP